MAQEKILGNQINLADLGPQLDQHLTTDLVTDLTPELGADLDVAGFAIKGLNQGTGNGDSVDINSGNGGSGTNDIGGAINLTAGTGGNGGSSVGGAINLTAGGGNAINGGDINIISGEGFSYGGTINIIGGYASGSYGGSINITAGTGATSVDGGTLTLSGGTHVAASSGNGGPVLINGGNSTAGYTRDGGAVQITGGSSAQGDGANIDLTPGGGTVNTGAITLHYASLTIGQASIQFWDDTDTGHTTGNYVALKAPAFVGTTNITFALPELDGTDGDVMLTDGAGNLSFGPWVLPKYTIGTLPLVVEGGQIYVTDAVAAGAATGAQCFGRGVGSPLLTEWVDVTTGVAVV